MLKNENLNSLTPRQRKAVARLQTLLQKRSQELKWRFAVGRLVERLVPSGTAERYGKESMPRLLRFLGRPLHFQAELYAARQVAACYSDADVAKLAGLRWCHLRWLAAVPDAKRRKELQRNCLKERWSCLRLSREIQKELGTRGRGGRKTRHLRNYGPAVSLKEMTRLAERWVACQDVWLTQDEKRLAGRLSASNANALQRDLELARDKLVELKKLLPDALVAVRMHLAELERENLRKKPKR